MPKKVIKALKAHKDWVAVVVIGAALGLNAAMMPPTTKTDELADFVPPATQLSVAELSDQHPAHRG